MTIAEDADLTKAKAIETLAYALQSAGWTSAPAGLRIRTAIEEEMMRLLET